MKKSLLVLLFLIASTNTFSEKLGLESGARSIWDEVRGSAGFIFAIIFLVSCFFNIGKVTGTDRDYKGFFIGVILWIAAIAVVAALISYLLSLSF